MSVYHAVLFPEPRVGGSQHTLDGDSAPSTPSRRGSWRKLKSMCEGLLNRNNNGGRPGEGNDRRFTQP